MPLDPAGTLASGGGAGTAYADSALADSTQHWTVDQWKGRRVVAGNVGGTIASNDENTITLDKPWSGPTPVAGSPYSINDSAAQAGSVSFADLLTNGTKQGVPDANAATAVATVTPSYTAHLTLVLDLQPPKTGNACSPDPCPYTMTNPDGSKTIIDQQPLGVDRLLIRTKDVGDLMTASLPIHTAVDLFANAGFFEVRLQGALDVCAHTDPVQAAAAPPVRTRWSPSSGRRGSATPSTAIFPMADLFTKLVSDPGSLVDYQTHIDAQADVTASIPDAASFLPAGSGGISAIWDDIGSGSTPTIDTSHIAELFKLDFSPDDPHAYFTVVLKVLQKLTEQIDSLDPNPAFDTKIPVLGKSFRDLLRSTDSGGGPSVSYTTTTLVDTARNGHDFPAALAGRSVVSGTQINVVKTASGNTLTFTDPWTTLPAPGTPYTFPHRARRRDLPDADLPAGLDAATRGDAQVAAGQQQPGHARLPNRRHDAVGGRGRRLEARLPDQLAGALRLHHR